MLAMGIFFFFLLGFVLGFWLVADAVLIIVSFGFLAAWQMVKEAIGTLKERTGSSQYAIAKYLEDIYKTGLPPNFKKILSVQLRNLTKQGKVYKVKNSFKLSDELKKPTKAPKLPTPAAAGTKEVTKEATKAPKTTTTTTTKTAKKPAKSKLANGAASTKSPKTVTAAKPVKTTKVSKVSSKPDTKSPKSPKAAVKVRKAPAPATKKTEEEVAPARKAASSSARKPAAVRKTPSKKVATPKKLTKSVKAAKSKPAKVGKPGKRSKTGAPSPAKKAKK